ncbi:MAG: hypothetical protein HKN43_12185 [Rhodothermales bacterium]|nr:hypothetical protein [Rhodothermales bacterium]
MTDSAAPDLSSGPVSERLAYLLTLVVNPLILPPITTFVTLSAMGNPLSSTITAVIVVTVCFALIPFGVMLLVVQSRKNVTIELRDRTSRTIPFTVSVIANIAALLFFLRWESALKPLMVCLMIVYLINNIGLLLINLRFKISLHMASIAGTAAILFFMRYGAMPILTGKGTMLLSIAIACALFIPVLWWARTRLKAHTEVELAWGTAFGLVLPPLELLALSPLFT